LSAKSDYTSYQIFDRWNGKSIIIDAPNILIDTMEVFDLDIWDNDLHTSNLKISTNETSFYQHNGKFSSSMKINVSGIINQGNNIINTIQEDILGGQVLFAFPLNPIYSCICGKVSLTDTNSNVTDVNVTISGAYSRTISPDSLGLYCFDSLLVGNYSVKAEMNNFVFSPESYSFTDLDNSYYDKDFVGNIQIVDSFYNVCGTIELDDAGANIQDVEITIWGDKNSSLYPDFSGDFCFDSLEKGTYLIKPQLSSFIFTPADTTLNNINASLYGIKFFGKKVNSIYYDYNKIRMILFPNPTWRFVTIIPSLELSKNALISVYNTTGELVDFTTKRYENNNTIKLELLNENSGLYYIQIVDNKIQLIGKVVLIK
jgi:hypothetical protein